MSQHNASGDGRRPNGSFAMVENDINRDPSLPQSVKSVYGVLCGYADENRVAWPGQDRLAYETSMSLRAVGKAVREGADCGLWSVIHTQTSNRYWLHDRDPVLDTDPHRYVPGTGPRAIPELPVGMRCRLERRQVPIGLARGADEIDQRARPVSETSTSSDAASGRHFAGSTTDRTIFIPHWLKRCEDRGKVSQYLVGAAVATMEAAGLEVSEDAKDAMGFTLDHKCESLTNMQLAERAQAWVLAAGTDDRNGWLGTWPQRKAS